MAKTVLVKVASSGKKVSMAEDAAKRLISTNPKEYSLIAPPVIDVTVLPPIAPVAEKKSVEVVEDEQKAKRGRPPIKA